MSSTYFEVRYVKNQTINRVTVGKLIHAIPIFERFKREKRHQVQLVKVSAGTEKIIAV